MFLVVDIGNTNIVLWVYDAHKLIFVWRLSTKVERTSDELQVFIYNLFMQNNLSMKVIEGVIVSSVVPDIMYTFSHSINKCFSQEPIIVGPGIKTGINIKIDNPKELGSDIIVNSVAAFEKYRDSAIVIDFGTATTFSSISKNGEFMGVCIMPGVKISSDALFLNAAKLPKVELVKPEKVIGKNTIHSMQSGIMLSIIGSVEYLIDSIKKEMLELNENNPTIIATGGLSTLISKYTKKITVVEPYLTLEGLKIIYQRNTISKEN